MFELGLDYHKYSIAELEEYKKAILKTIEYVKRDSINPSLLTIGLGGSPYDVARYLEHQILSIDKEIQVLSNLMMNNFQLFNQVGLQPHSSSSSSRMDRIEKRIDKIETKTDDVREEVHERLQEKMPRIDRVNDYLDSFEAEEKYNKDNDKTE